MEKQQNQKVENGGSQQPSATPEFTNSDAEQLYNSCVDMQRITFSMPMEVQLSKLITKLKNWTAPITESKNRRAKELGFIVNGNQYINDPKWSPETQVEKVGKLSNEFQEIAQSEFDEWVELKKILPLPLFTEDKFGDDGYTFIEESNGRQAQNRQYFIEYCIVKK